MEAYKHVYGGEWPEDVKDVYWGEIRQIAVESREGEQGDAINYVLSPDRKD